MRRQKNNGLQIISQAHSTADNSFLACGLCAAMLFSLGTLCGSDTAWHLGIAGGGICIAHHFLGRKVWFFPGILTALVILTVLFRGTLLDGFCQLCNAAGDIYTAWTGVAIPPLESSGNALSRMLFGAWAGVLTGLGFCALLGWKLLPTAVILVMTAASLLLGRMTDPLPLILAVLLLGGKGTWKTRTLPALAMAVLLLLFSLPGATAWVQSRSAQVSDALHQYQYETKYTTLPEGRLEPLRQSDAPALIVTMEKPEVLYLRGFTGAELVEDGWKPIDPGILAENEALLYWLNDREFDIRAQFAAAYELEITENQITIQNLGACSAYRFIPFTVFSDDGMVSENLADTLPGSRYDTFTCVYGGAELLPELLENLSDSRYLRAEAAYREFVQAHYLSVPAWYAEQMQPWWEKADDPDAQSAVKAVLESCYPNGLPGDPYGATAAVLTLRHFGIPARYAEGYILPATTEKTVELTDRHAACWAEVYQGGIGWVPMALTPGLDGQKEQQEENPLPPDTPEETLPPETEPQTDLEPEGGYQVRIAQALLNGAIVLTVGLLLLILLLILRRRYILKKRQALLDQPDIREAITWSFADSVSVLERMGIHRGNGSLDAMTEPIAEQFGADARMQFEAASRLNAKALFSSKPMTEEERKTVHNFRAAVLTRLQKNSGYLHRLWMKYILCRF